MPNIAARAAACASPAAASRTIYFAFTIGTSNAVSDVEVTARAIRKTVTIHALVAFIFNVTMIALTVSIAGDAISGK
jgi:uncharacterized membrane protein